MFVSERVDDSLSFIVDGLTVSAFRFEPDFVLVDFEELGSNSVSFDGEKDIC